MVDLAGLDIGWRSRQDRGESSPIEDKLCEQGRFGQKTGMGYFKYAGSRFPSPDEVVERFIDKTIAELGLKRRSIDDQEILERLTYPMINEAARILDEGVAVRSGDIDIVWIYGYGWPIATGGPMFHADQVGLKHIADRLHHYATQDDDASLRPTPFLQQLAECGGTFLGSA
jgi:3-hydroxyacyl-CoA dehydrogenase